MNGRAERSTEMVTSSLPTASTSELLSEKSPEAAFAVTRYASGISLAEDLLKTEVLEVLDLIRHVY
jgi:hypothetical protein